MNDALVAAIQRFTLEARHLLEQEAGEQLEGLYGWLPDGRFAPAGSYPALAQLEEARETRRKLEAHAAEEREAGFEARTARRRLVGETAFTWLNRIVALRMMEERGLLKATIGRLERSNSFLYWIAEEKQAETRTLYEQGDVPVNAVGEGPRQEAYRRFLVWQCGELAREVSVLFDPNTLSTRLFPRPALLKTLVGAMGEASLAEAWKAGNEETVGWVYQAFNARELQAAFAGAREHGKKFEAEDIPAVTQLFTIRWVVRLLVENTLGRLWVEMHPDSRLRETLGYLAPTASYRGRALKRASEITFLDPACGSMHFGLLAFDLFAEMYREELENAGTAGWPDTPSVKSVDEIPAAIVRNNIHGIDIDPRAVQLSALTLFLRARSTNPRCAFTDRNLACANVEAITGGRIDEIIRLSHFTHPIYARILQRMALSLRDSECLGSLLRPERDLEQLIGEERRKADRELLMLPNLPADQFDSEEGLVEFFGILHEQIMRHLDAFTAQSRLAGHEPAHFVAEAAKGLRFMRMVQNRYDVVTTNPPYLSARKMNKHLGSLMADQYPESKTDLYAAFIVRCHELLNDTGLLGMLTMQSFMFISSYEGLRAKLRDQVDIVALAQFGGGLFAVGNPGTLQTVAFALRRDVSAGRRQQNVGTYFRLVHERDADGKRVAFEAALAATRAGKEHPLVFRCRQGAFDDIPDKPWVYWMPERIRALFRSLPRIYDVARPRQGLATADNNRFLRKWWEVGPDRIGFGMASRAAAQRSGKRWFPYMKGGSAVPWYGNQEHVVDWADDAAAMRCFGAEDGHVRSALRNVDFYFRKGVTWSDVSSRGFAARLSPGGFVHDVKGMTCYPEETDVELVLGLLNSGLAKFITAALNPTISNQVGDIERIPVPGQRDDRIKALVSECVELVQQDSRESEITYEFVQPPQRLDEPSARRARLGEREAEIDGLVSSLYGLTEEDLGAIERELSLAGTDAGDGKAEVENGEAGEGGTAGALTARDLGLRWLSYSIGIALGRFEPGCESGLGRGELAASIAAELRELSARDGILANDPGQPLDIGGRVWRILAAMRGDDEAKRLVKAALGQGDPLALVQDWLDRFAGQPGDSAWRYHFQLYAKRPVYWPLQSPKRRYTVWVFHERCTPDTLYQIRNGIVEPRVRLAERQIADLRKRSLIDRGARKELDAQLDLADDLRAFSGRLREMADRGYIPHIDDGVLLNAAPLHTLLPSWPETAEAWRALEAGEYDWAQQAMAYRPACVKAACRKNRSLAIAHGLEGQCDAPGNGAGRGNGARKKGTAPIRPDIMVQARLSRE